ncbi:MAG: InlB B-repeat-containing protein [Oscillospiraceae bacterium]|nr:InlB B-repeat-containing protein [Oscillospiraceae bacterium]
MRNTAKHTKRALSIAMALTMLLTLLPMAMAAPPSHSLDDFVIFDFSSQYTSKVQDDNGAGYSYVFNRPVDPTKPYGLDHPDNNKEYNRYNIPDQSKLTPEGDQAIYSMVNEGPNGEKVLKLENSKDFFYNLAMERYEEDNEVGRAANGGAFSGFPESNFPNNYQYLVMTFKGDTARIGLTVDGSGGTIKGQNFQAYWEKCAQAELGNGWRTVAWTFDDDFLDPLRLMLRLPGEFYIRDFYLTNTLPAQGQTYTVFDAAYSLRRGAADQYQHDDKVMFGSAELTDEGGSYSRSNGTLTITNNKGVATHCPGGKVIGVGPNRAVAPISVLRSYRYFIIEGSASAKDVFAPMLGGEGIGFDFGYQPPNPGDQNAQFVLPNIGSADSGQTVTGSNQIFVFDSQAWGKGPIAIGDYNEVGFHFRTNGSVGIRRIYLSNELPSVTFDSNGGSSVAKRNTGVDGLVSKPADPTRPGFRFAGWFTARTGGSAWNFASSRATTHSTTLYARWTQINPVKVTFRANKGSGSMTAQDFLPGTAQALKANAFTRAGWDFKGWATSATGRVVHTNRKSITVNGPITLHAVWTAKRPKAPKTVKTSSKKKKQATVTYRNGDSNRVDGYQVRHAATKNMKKAKNLKASTKLSASIKKLPRKRNRWIQVRSFRRHSDNKQLFSSWTKAKKVKVK